MMRPRSAWEALVEQIRQEAALIRALAQSATAPTKPRHFTLADFHKPPRRIQ